MTTIQTAALRKFANGDIVHRCTYLNINTPDSYFFSAGMATIRMATVEALMKAGFIEDFEDPQLRWRGSRYRVTEAGKAEIVKRGESR